MSQLSTKIQYKIIQYITVRNCDMNCTCEGTEVGGSIRMFLSHSPGGSTVTESRNSSRPIIKCSRLRALKKIYNLFPINGSKTNNYMIFSRLWALREGVKKITFYGTCLLSYQTKCKKYSACPYALKTFLLIYNFIIK